MLDIGGDNNIELTRSGTEPFVRIHLAPRMASGTPPDRQRRCPVLRTISKVANPPARCMRWNLFGSPR